MTHCLHPCLDQAVTLLLAVRISNHLERHDTDLPADPMDGHQHAEKHAWRSPQGIEHFAVYL